jgi:preprotein translocase SecE subunit
MEQVQVAPRGGRVVQWIRGVRDFLAAVRSEMGKVSWPTQDELLKATRMVVMLAVFIGIVLGLVDLLLTKILVNGVAALGRPQ